MGTWPNDNAASQQGPSDPGFFGKLFDSVGGIFKKQDGSFNIKGIIGALIGGVLAFFGAPLLGETVGGLAPLLAAAGAVGGGLIANKVGGGEQEAGAPSAPWPAPGTGNNAPPPVTGQGVQVASGLPPQARGQGFTRS